MSRSGTTILEVLLALLILGGAVAVLGEFSRNAFRNAKASKDITQAELLAESILAKVRIGIIEMESAFDVPMTNSVSVNLNDTISDTNALSENSEALWLYTLEVTELDDYGLVALSVTVRQNKPEEQHPVACHLVRWFALEPEEEENTTQ
ncbi:MAG: hypothetical protein LBQ50_06130 [Planctomycetaceae bacterium]|nr:hypothetical protein [Planctomycetaceae bacterium]